MNFKCMYYIFNDPTVEVEVKDMHDEKNGHVFISAVYFRQGKLGEKYEW